jgi:F-type H+-transporting ATPase subunit epsilon
MSHEIDLEKARHDLERAKESGENDDEIEAAVRRHEARVRAAEQAS